MLFQHGVNGSLCLCYAIGYTTVQKFCVGNIFLKEKNTQQICIELVKSDS